MSLKRYDAKRDTNEPEIVETLTRAGCTVQRLSKKGCPDLLVGFVDERGKKRILLMEVKHKKGRRTPQQIEFALWWNGTEPVVVRSIEDALRAIGAVD